MTAIEFILWALGGLLVLGIAGAIVKKSREYNMRIFVSKEYALLCLGAIACPIALITVQPFEDGLIVSCVLGFLLFTLALISNIRKSNPAFGTVFTIFQTLMVACFVVTFLAALHYITEKTMK